jgi:hypothetical protein
MVDITSLVNLSLLVDGQVRHAVDVTTPLNNLIDIINDILNGDLTFDEVQATVAQIATLNVTNSINSERDGAALVARFDTYANGATTALTARRARNTKASPQAVQTNDILGSFGGAGHDGSAFTSYMASMWFEAAQNWSSGVNGTQIRFRTTANGGSTLADALIIHNDKSLEIEGAINHDGAAIGFFGTAPAAQNTGWTAFANLLTDKTCDANSTTVAELADILGTLIETLKGYGLLAA